MNLPICVAALIAEKTSVPLRWQEVALPLMTITMLIILKYIPATAHLPLSRAAGVVAFGYAAFLALRLVQSEDGIMVEGGWAELRPSLVEYFACYGSAALAAILLFAVIVMGSAADTTQLVATYIAVLFLAAGSVGIGVAGLFTQTRWDNRQVRHRSAAGRETTIDWSDVRAVRPNWRGITISGTTGRITFSQFHGGASQLAKHAATRAKRNAETATKAFAAS
ncbi:hypothetical protein DEVEQU_02911 [Devosia equisanguinis]|uniref:PH domain-containing protein n=1 Tax=Devosia equisanguinis TaxID=2490941 RepID=A0A447IE88_9HYPH|nr:MAG: hypothetical protein ABS74_12300 [Pelagibacterium sp. SCN 63-126]ODU88906.1 MAG: hypothetical protein ABT14_01175 [Pelagibacterium sp. SCN 63-17]OJX43199.1 MAG: hypothetical protein BGO80_17570 [Devosia sp. 63-57]VDS05768.1 hypothetical protein DEVEQU_02911 [Devosia equisanguinis]